MSLADGTLGLVARLERFSDRKSASGAFVHARAACVGTTRQDSWSQHLIPADRLNKRYFRRWFYWRGISRALLFQQQGLDMESPQETRHDFTRVPRMAGTPRYLFRVALRHAGAALKAVLRGRRVAAFEHELWLWMFAGILQQRWRDRREPFCWANAVGGAQRADSSRTEARVGTAPGRTL